MAAVRGPALTTPEDAAPIFLDIVGRNLPVVSEGILVVYPGWQADAARRLLRLARGVLDTDRVASIGLDLPPLACSLVADLLSYSAPHLQIGYLAGLARRLQTEILSGARLASVAKLEHIETKLTDHVASYSPNSGFLAWAAPRPGVERIASRTHLATVDFRPADPIHLIIASDGSEFPDFVNELMSTLRPQVVKTVPAQPLGVTFWGTRKHVEFVAFSGHPQALPHFVRSTRYWVCRWCRQPTSLEICAVCGMFQDNAPVVPPGPPAGGPGTPDPGAERPASPRAPVPSSVPPGQGLAAPTLGRPASPAVRPPAAQPSAATQRPVAPRPSAAPGPGVHARPSAAPRSPDTTRQGTARTPDATPPAAAPTSPDQAKPPAGAGPPAAAAPLASPVSRPAPEVVVAPTDTTMPDAGRRATPFGRKTSPPGSPPYAPAGAAPSDAATGSPGPTSIDAALNGPARNVSAARASAPDDPEPMLPAPDSPLSDPPEPNGHGPSGAASNARPGGHANGALPPCRPATTTGRTHLPGDRLVAGPADTAGRPGGTAEPGRTSPQNP